MIGEQGRRRGRCGTEGFGDLGERCTEADFTPITLHQAISDFRNPCRFLRWATSDASRCGGHLGFWRGP